MRKHRKNSEQDASSRQPAQQGSRNGWDWTRHETGSCLRKRKTAYVVCIVADGARVAERLARSVLELAAQAIDAGRLLFLVVELAAVAVHAGAAKKEWVRQGLSDEGRSDRGRRATHSNRPNSDHSRDSEAADQKRQIHFESRDWNAPDAQHQVVLARGAVLAEALAL